MTLPRERNLSVTVHKQWRFFWPHAHDDMNGARWRDQPPTEDELREWREDLPTCWIEEREVHYGTPRVVGDYIARVEP